MSKEKVLELVLDIVNAESDETLAYYTGYGRPAAEIDKAISDAWKALEDYLDAKE